MTSSQTASAPVGLNEAAANVSLALHSTITQLNASIGRTTLLVLVGLAAFAVAGMAVLAVMLARPRRSASRPDGGTLSADGVGIQPLVLEVAGREIIVGADLVARAGRGTGVVLGAGDAADVPIADAGDASLRLTREGGRLFVTNRGREGDVAVLDVPLKSNLATPVYSGDRIRLGKTELTAWVG